MNINYDAFVKSRLAPESRTPNSIGLTVLLGSTIREAILMATIKELYQRANNPDLTHWKDISLFSVIEAALLTAAIDPLIYEGLTEERRELTSHLRTNQPTNWQHAILMIRALRQAICMNEINCKLALIYNSNYDGDIWSEKIEQLDLTLDHIDKLDTTSTKISRKEYYKWLKNNGYFEARQQVVSDPEPIDVYQEKMSIDNDISLLSEPTYTTPALEAIQGVVHEFWISYDPDSNQPPPKQSTVTDWIKENHPNIQAADICKYIDKICRHPNAKNGGNRKLNT